MNPMYMHNQTLQYRNANCLQVFKLQTVVLRNLIFLEQTPTTWKVVNFAIYEHLLSDIMINS